MSNAEPLSHTLRQSLNPASPDSPMQPSERLFWATFNSSPAAQVVTDVGTGAILEVNEAYCRLVGHPRSALLGRTALEMDIWLDPNDRQEALQALLRRVQVQWREALSTAWLSLRGNRLRTARVNSSVKAST